MDRRANGKLRPSLKGPHVFVGKEEKTGSRAAARFDNVGSTPCP
jgi:hypothetical protein